MSLHCTLSNILSSCLGPKGSVRSDCCSTPSGPLQYPALPMNQQRAAKPSLCLNHANLYRIRLLYEHLHQPGGVPSLAVLTVAPSHQMVSLLRRAFPDHAIGGISPPGPSPAHLLHTYPAGPLIFFNSFALFSSQCLSFFLKSTYFLNKSSLK